MANTQRHPAHSNTYGSAPGQALRLTMVQVLINSKGYNMNPLQSLYYVSPACMISLAPGFGESSCIPTGPHACTRRRGPWSCFPVLHSSETSTPTHSPIACAVFKELNELLTRTDWTLNYSVMLANALTAFVLNLAVFLLIGKTSALTMNIAGVIKVGEVRGIGVRELGPASGFWLQARRPDGALCWYALLARPDGALCLYALLVRSDGALW